MRSLPQGSISNLILQVTRDNPSRFQAPYLGEPPFSSRFFIALAESAKSPRLPPFYGGGKIGKISAAIPFL